MTERIVEWQETEHIEYIDDLVEQFEKAGYGIKIEDGYMDTFNAIHLADWKSEFLTWFNKVMQEFTTILEEVHDLPDDEYELYLEVEEDGETKYIGVEEDD